MGLPPKPIRDPARLGCHRCPGSMYLRTGNMQLYYAECDQCRSCGRLSTTEMGAWESWEKLRQEEICLDCGDSPYGCGCA
jgi:hypothetical protein